MPASEHLGTLKTEDGESGNIGSPAPKVNDLTVASRDEIMACPRIDWFEPDRPCSRRSLMPLRGVLFDFDGVIADTENIHVAAWQRTLAEMGWELPDDVAIRAAEEDDNAFLGSLFAQRGITDGNVMGWYLRKQRITHALLRDWPCVYPGVVELVNTLRERYPLGIVSGSNRKNVRAVLDTSELRGRFKCVVSRELFHQPKPDPEGYRFGCRMLDREPAEVVALEDSPAGLAAARAAGLHTLAIGHRRPPGNWTGSAPYLAGLADTARVLEALAEIDRSLG
jgi:beta-phosphoglucomutase